MTSKELIEQVCCNPLDKDLWGTWKTIFNDSGLKIIIDNSGNSEITELTSDQVRHALEKCEFTFTPPEEESTLQVVDSNQLNTQQWRERFSELNENPPIMQYVHAEDGGKIKLTIELHPGREPLIYTRVYIPTIVGRPLAWYAQGENDFNDYGWKMILLPKSRDEAIKRFGIREDNAYVMGVKVIKLSETRRSMLGEISHWCK